MKAHRSVSASNFAGANPFDSEESDPMSGLANLADAMLVFACGLLIALVVSHGLDISSDLVEMQESDMSEVVEDVEQMTDEITSGGKGYEELGMVYRDPETGKMYMLTEEAE